MPNPCRKAHYCLPALLAGAAPIRFGALRHGPAGGDRLPVAAIAAGFTPAPATFPIARRP